MKRGVFLLALLAGCLPNTHASWRTSASLPEGLRVKDTVALGSDGVLVVGYTAPDAAAMPDRFEPVVARYDGQLTLSQPDRTGWIESADARGDDAWMVLAHLKPSGEGSTYTLMVSSDRGATWAAPVPIPSESLTAVVLEGGGCGWVLGVRELLRTCDSGAIWTPSVPARCCRGVAQPLASTGPGEATLGGATLQRTVDGGASWTHIADADVLATDGRFAVARSADGTIRVGRIGASSVTWTGVLPGEHNPSRLRSDGDRLIVRSAPLGKRAGAGTLVLRSQDAGATWTEDVLRGGGPASRVGLVDPDGAWRVTQGRRLRRGTWR